MLSKFVEHLTSAQKGSKVRSLLNDSWEGIATDDEVSALKSFLLSPGVGVSYLNQNLAPKLSTAGFQGKFAGVFCHKKPTVTHGAEDVISRALLHTGCFEEASAPLHNGRPDSDDPEPADAQRPGRGPLDLSGGAKAPADVVDPAGADALVSPRYSTQRLPERS